MSDKSLTIRRADDKVYDIEIKDADGVVVDINYYTVKFTVRKNYNDSTAIIFKSSPTVSGISFIDAINGKARLTLRSADTSIDIGKYVYDVEITDSSGRKTTVIYDNLRIVPDVTR